MPTRMHDHEVAVPEPMVRAMIDRQFPQWRRHELQLVEPWGTDNAIWRLGPDLVVRLPRVEGAVEQVGFEAIWLSVCARYVNAFEVPQAVAVGAPDGDYPFPWAVHHWLPGSSANPRSVADSVDFALDMARLVLDLRSIPIEGGRAARNRARPLTSYTPSGPDVIASASHLIDADAAMAVWNEAVAAPEVGLNQRTWVHGDLEFNCLTMDGRLSGVVDWGSACVGDPAVDVQVMWSALFTDRARAAFIEALGVDDAALARSRGAAIQQACGALPYYLDTYPLMVERSWQKLENLGVDRL